MINEASQQKRTQLLDFIQRTLQLPVRGVIVTGSVAVGNARPDSDIDGIIFLDPYDEYIVPAEFIWRPSDGSFHQHSLEVDWITREGVQFDFARFDLSLWSSPTFEWPEGRCAELADGWIAYDRDGKVAELIRQKTEYTDSIRLYRLDDAITWLDQYLSDGKPENCWVNLGLVIAHDRLQAAFDRLVEALFAINYRWMPWRKSRMSSLLDLSWLPDDFSERVQIAMNSPSLDHNGYLVRLDTLRALFSDCLSHLQVVDTYGDNPLAEAFIRGHEEPGRAWNMEVWNSEHKKRYE